MGDHARCARVCWRRHKSHRFAGVIVEDLGRNLAGGQHPTHLCHHATRFLHPKAETYELFRTNFGCLEEDGSLAASRSVSRCCSKGFAVSSIRDSGTAKTVHANVTGQWMFQKSSAPNQGQSAALVSWSSAPYPPTRCRWPVPARHLLPFLPLGRAGASTQMKHANQHLASMSLAPNPPLPARFSLK